MNRDTFTMQPIGVVRSPYTDTTQIPKGPGTVHDAEGVLEIRPALELGLTDIEGFSHLYVLWVFDRAAGHELLGTPPVDTRPHGVFATRSPRRPNPIGLTTVRLVRREGPSLFVRGVDMLDGTAILDIKPYLSSVPPHELRRGWVAEAERARVHTPATPLTRAALLQFLRARRYAVQSSVHASGAPQSAVVGIAVSDDFEVVFDTLSTSRKGENLRRRPEIALVIGSLEGRDERTVQLEGRADEPTGVERRRLTELYFGVFPDGRERQKWPGLTYFRATPSWLRYSDYNIDPPEIVEFDSQALRALR